MIVKPFFALLAAGTFTLVASPATASSALVSGLSAPTAGLIQLGEGCEGGKCKGKKGEEAPAEGATVFSSMISLGEGCEGGKCKGKKGEEAPAEGATVFSSMISLGEGCEGGKCKGKKGDAEKGEEVPA